MVQNLKVKEKTYRFKITECTYEIELIDSWCWILVGDEVGQVLTKQFGFNHVGDNQPFGRLNSRASQPDLCFIKILATAWTGS